MVIAAGGTGAIFVGQDAKPVFAKIGDRVGPYRVAAIADGQVTVETATGTQILHPVFAQGPSPTAAPASSSIMPPPSGAASSPIGARIPSAEALRRMIGRQDK